MIELKNVSYTYQPGAPFEKVALHNINLSVNKGEFIGLIGHTGSGKSTLIQMLNGLLKPTSGEVLIDGQSLADKHTELSKIRFKVGLVMQYPEYQLFEETVYKDIAFGPTNMGLTPDEIDVRVCDAARLTGISEQMLENSPFELSGGQKRRAAIAGVVAMKPEVLVLDEPTAGLDPKGRREILGAICDMHRQTNSTVILVSHNMEDIAKLSDRIIVLEKGAVAMIGTPAEIFSNPEKLAAMGLNVPPVTVVAEKLQERGVNVKKGIYTVSQLVEELAPRHTYREES